MHKYCVKKKRTYNEDELRIKLANERWLKRQCHYEPVIKYTGNPCSLLCRQQNNYYGTMKFTENNNVQNNFTWRAQSSQETQNIDA